MMILNSNLAEYQYPEEQRPPFGKQFSQTLVKDSLRSGHVRQYLTKKLGNA
jgi:hypothetical protein